VDLRLERSGPADERVEGVVPGRWESVALICGVRLSGVAAPLAFPGGVDGAAFHQYVEEVLTPELRPGDVVVWDDLKPHQAEGVVKAVEKGRRRGRAAAAVGPEPRPDRGDVLEGQGRAPLGAGRRHDG
jgi:hypothetical protein